MSLNEPLELQVQALLARRPIRMYHATRLLPAEIEAIRTEGLKLQTPELRRSKLQRLVGAGFISGAGAALWEQHGPVFWTGHEARVNELCVVSPLEIFDESADSFEDLFRDWGGESLAWAAAERGREGLDTPSDEIRVMLTRINRHSVQAVVEVAIEPTRLPRFPFLIDVMSGRLNGFRKAFNEWHLDRPASRVVDIIQPGHPRWNPSWFRQR